MGIILARDFAERGVGRDIGGIGFGIDARDGFGERADVELHQRADHRGDGVGHAVLLGGIVQPFDGALHRRVGGVRGQRCDEREQGEGSKGRPTEHRLHPFKGRESRNGAFFKGATLSLR